MCCGSRMAARSGPACVPCSNTAPRFTGGRLRPASRIRAMATERGRIGSRIARSVPLSVPEASAGRKIGGVGKPAPAVEWTASPEIGGSGRGCGRVVTPGLPEWSRNVASQPAPKRPHCGRTPSSFPRSDPPRRGGFAATGVATPPGSTVGSASKRRLRRDRRRDSSGLHGRIRLEEAASPRPASRLLRATSGRTGSRRRAGSRRSARRG